jgi:hypothetical protein
MEDDVARFVIGGKEYEVPEVDSFTMGEAIIVWDYCQLSLDEVGDNGRHPGLIAAFMHIAYQRGNPESEKVKVRELIEESSLVAAMEKLGGDDANPPIRTTEEPPSSLPSSSSSDKSSGPDSVNGSVERDDVPRSIGATR